MEPKSEITKLPDMVMCGDHPSFTKTELNAKETKDEDSALALHRPPAATEGYIGPLEPQDRGERRERASSAHALRPDRRRLDVVPDNNALVQAALGSFRWPPYLLAAWVLVLFLTHALHCLVAAMERALPRLRQLCQYFRVWTEDSWKGEIDAKRILPIALALLTGLLYAVYFAVYLMYSVALWSIEPLCTEPKIEREGETRVTDYAEGSKSNSSFNQP